MILGSEVDSIEWTLRFEGADAATPVTSIPKIMRHHGWKNGAWLLDTWLSRASAIFPTYGPTVTNVIKMAWVLKFQRAKEVFDSMVAARVWANAPAQKEIARMLKKSGYLTAAPMSRPFGNLNAHIQLLDMDYVNQRSVTFGVGNLDDLSAALGNFTLRVAVAGGVTPLTASKFHVIINEVAIYVRDSFDFEGEQFLGFWDDSDNSVSMLNPLSGTSISNQDFRDWRAATGLGGDFLVFSDAHRLRLTTPDEFDV